MPAPVARVEVEHDHLRRLDVVGPSHRRVQLERREVGGPHDRRHRVEHAVADVAAAVTGPEGGADPVGPVARAALLEEALAVDAVREPSQGDPPVADVGEQHRRDAGVVVDDLALGEPGLRVQHLVEVGEAEAAPLDLDVGQADLRAATFLAGRFAAFLAGARLVAFFAVERLAAARLAGRAGGLVVLGLVGASGARVALAGLLGRRHARLERGHEVDHLGGGRLLGRSHDLGGAARLAVDQLEHLVAVGVAEPRRLELGAEALDELAGHRHLLVGDLDVGDRVELGDLLGRVELVRVDHRREHQPTVDRPDRGEVLLRAHHEAGDADLAALLHRALQQRVGLERGLVGRDEVGGVVEHRVDVGEVDELLDLDRARRLGVERGELLVGDEHVLTRCELVALRQRLGRHLGAVGLGHPLLLDAGARAGVDLVEVHRLARHRSEELDRDADQPEADRSTPDGAGHADHLARDRHHLARQLPEWSRTYRWFR